MSSLAEGHNDEQPDPRLTAEHYTDEGLLPFHAAAAPLPKVIITTTPPSASEAREG
jgi:hypothetical protein